MSESDVSIVAEVHDDGVRADVVLGRRVPGLSRRVARRLALEGGLRIDGQRGRPSDRVHPGQKLTLSLPATHQGEGPLEVLRVTHDFVYVTKPAGIHTVALTPAQADCLSVWVARAHPECAEASEDPREGGAVHRLDQDTSGVVAFARSRPAWKMARQAFDAGEVGKRYLAVCTPEDSPGWPPEAPADALVGWLEPAPSLSEPIELSCEVPPEIIAAGAFRIRAPIGRGPERGAMAIRLDGQGATSVVQVRGRVHDGLVCELELQTGRRHQARVHLAWAGLPILGDARYGRTRADRLHLHAARLDLSAKFPEERPISAHPDGWLSRRSMPLEAQGSVLLPRP